MCTARLALTTSVAKCTVNYCATNWLDSTITAPASAYHRASYAERYRRFSQACLLGYTPSPQQAFQRDAAHQAQRHTWLTPKDSPGTWYTRKDYRSRWTIGPFHRTGFTAHT